MHTGHLGTCLHLSRCRLSYFHAGLGTGLSPPLQKPRVSLVRFLPFFWVGIPCSAPGLLQAMHPGITPPGRLGGPNGMPRKTNFLPAVLLLQSLVRLFFFGGSHAWLCSGVTFLVCLGNPMGSQGLNPTGCVEGKCPCCAIALAPLVLGGLGTKSGVGRRRGGLWRVFLLN